ncbi:MAG: PaaI family thioesterase, partial [Comamonas sp.]|nr:PaaI family thioesterase [Comamonas sp.]
MTAPTTLTAAHSMAQSLAHPAADVPPGFVPFPAGGNFMHINGPLYLLHQGEVVKFGMRVQER